MTALEGRTLADGPANTPKQRSGANGTRSRVAQFFRPAKTPPVLAGRRAKQPPILSAELRGTVIPHGKTDSGDVLRRQQEPGAGFLQAYLLLKLEGAQGCHPQKMTVEGCEAHAGHVRQILDPDGFGIVVPNPPDGPADLRHAAVSKAELAHHCALRAVDQSPKDFALDGRCQYRNVLRPIQQPKDPDDRIQQAVRQVAIAKSLRLGLCL